MIRIHLLSYIIEWTTEIWNKKNAFYNGTTKMEILDINKYNSYRIYML